MKKVGIIKYLLCLCLIFLLSIHGFASIVSDNDGSAFITKSEFDALKASFQSQIDSYNNSIDSKIDGAIAAYLAGIMITTKEAQVIPWAGNTVSFVDMPQPDLGWADPGFYAFLLPMHSSGTQYMTLGLNLNGLVDSSGVLNTETQVRNKTRYSLAAIKKTAAAVRMFEKWDQYMNVNWPNWFDEIPDSTDAQNPEVLRKAWNALSFSVACIENHAGKDVLIGIGRCSTGPADATIVTTTQKSAATVNIPEDYNVFLEERADGWGEINPRFEDLSREETTSVGQTHSVHHMIATKETLASTSILFNKNTNKLTLNMKVAPYLEINTQLTSDSSVPGYYADQWVKNNKGLTSSWTVYPSDSRDYSTFSWASTYKCYKYSTTVVRMMKSPGCALAGVPTLDPQSYAMRFDQDALFAKGNGTNAGWISTTFPIWIKGSGLTLSKVINANENGEFQGAVKALNPVLSDNTNPYYVADEFVSTRTIGYAPVAWLEPEDDDLQKITDFYAPLYADTGMDQYGKTYIDGACMCKASNRGDLTIKLKTSSATTLYFNKEPFATADASGNIEYTVNGANKTAGTGVDVGAGAMTTILFKSVDIGDRFYIKPKDGTTIDFISAEIANE